jgi:aspartate kinase
MNPRPVLVQKFGGTSVSTPERRELVVGHVRRAREEGYLVTIVISAMGRRGDPYATDTLLDLLRADGGSVLPSDYTLMFVTGEIISVALMSHTLNRAGIAAVGMSGAQARIFTDGHPTEAEILDIDVSRLRHHLERGDVPVVTGGQGIERESFNYNTLGRGASDTSGVALGAWLGAQKVEIFTDVDGIASADPRLVPDAELVGTISFARMHEFARFGAKVIHPRAVAAGWRAKVPVVVRSTFSSSPGTWIGEVSGEPPFSGVAALAPMETVSVGPSGIGTDRLTLWERRRLIMSLVDAYTRNVILGCADAAELESAMAEAGVTPSRRTSNCAWISVIGDTSLVTGRQPEDLRILAAAGVECGWRGTGPFRSTYVVPASLAADAVRALHAAYSRLAHSSA